MGPRSPPMDWLKTAGKRLRCLEQRVGGCTEHSNTSLHHGITLVAPSRHTYLVCRQKAIHPNGKIVRWVRRIWLSWPKAEKLCGYSPSHFCRKHHLLCLDGLDGSLLHSWFLRNKDLEFSSSEVLFCFQSSWDQSTLLHVYFSVSQHRLNRKFKGAKVPGMLLVSIRQIQ